MELTAQKEVFFRTGLVPLAQMANLLRIFHKPAFTEEMNVLARFALHTKDADKLRAVYGKVLEAKKLMAESVKLQDAFSTLCNERYALLPRYVTHDAIQARAELQGRNYLEVSREMRDEEQKQRQAVKPQADSLEREEKAKYALFQQFRAFFDAVLAEIFTLIEYSWTTRHQWIGKYSDLDSPLTKGGKCLKWTTFVRHLGLVETLDTYGLTAIAEKRLKSKKVKSSMGQYLAPLLWEEVFGVQFASSSPNDKDTLLAKLKALLSQDELTKVAEIFRDPSFEVATL